MPGLSFLLYALAAVAGCLALPVLAWYVVTALWGLAPLRGGVGRPTEKRLRFAVIVCARHEEAVIGQLLDSLKAQDYPQDSYQMFVIADNCTRDDTAGAARAYGATVYERRDEKKVGKGYALEWALARIREDYPDRFDAVCVFDADNLAAPDFLSRMNEALQNGADVAEGYRETINPGETWVSGCYALYWMFLMRFFYRARRNLGMSCMVCGTGFAFKMEVLGPEGWHTRTVTEDCEFSIQQITAGRTIAFVSEAVFYDEQPRDFATSLHQRFRWLVGAAQATYWCMKTVIRGIRAGHRGSVDMLAFVLAGPAAVLLLLQGVFLLAGTLLRAATPVAVLCGVAVSLAVSYVAVVLAAMLCAALEKKSIRRLWKSILLFPLFMLPMGFMPVAALIHPRVGWKPIEHRRTSTIDEVVRSEDLHTR